MSTDSQVCRDCGKTFDADGMDRDRCDSCVGDAFGITHSCISCGRELDPRNPAVGTWRNVWELGDDVRLCADCATGEGPGKFEGFTGRDYLIAVALYAMTMDQSYSDDVAYPPEDSGLPTVTRIGEYTAWEDSQGFFYFERHASDVVAADAISVLYADMLDEG